jgi:hypothetical protein
MADITSPRNLNPIRRHRSYPRVVRRARHNSYRVKRPGDTGTRHPGPPTIRLVNLPATVMINLGEVAVSPGPAASRKGCHVRTKDPGEGACPGRA